MSLNLQLDASGKLVVSKGNARLVDATEQRVATRLRMLLGEWFLDLSDGTPYLQDILVQGPRLDLIRTAITDRVRKTEGVRDVTSVGLAPDRVRRSLGITVQAIGPTGPFTVTV